MLNWRIWYILPLRLRDNSETEGHPGMFPNLLPVITLLGKGMENLSLREAVSLQLMLPKRSQVGFHLRNLRWLSRKVETGISNVGSVGG